MTTASDWLRQAVQHHRRGELAAAERAYAAALDADAGNIDALNMLGVLRQQRGDAAGALRFLDRALAIAPAHAGALNNRAAVNLAAGDYAAAEQDAALATRAAPQLAGAWLNLGLALDGRGDTAAAAAALRRGAQLQPDDARLLLAWFSAAARSQQAAELAQRSRLAPPLLASQRERALRAAAELARYGYSNQALYLLSQLRAELPADAEVAHHFAFEAAYRQACEQEFKGDFDAALRAAETLLAALPAHRGARLLRASVRGARGEAARASDEYRSVIEHTPDDALAADAYLVGLQYDPAVSADALAQAHFDWAQRQLRHVAPRTPPADPDAERVLRIGWLSPRLFGGLAATFFLPVLGAFDRTRGWHVLYESGGIEDDVTLRFRAAADAHRDVSRLDDAELTQAIRADRIDVLVELSGHGPGNRLRALAARPAPLQVSWLDYFHSTGSPAIDVLLSDAVLSPPSALHRYSERVATLPSGRLCYTPPHDAPPVQPRAAGAAPRFACFNRIEKINDAVLEAWAKILDATPNSTLRLKARLLDSAAEREHFLARAGRAGIDASRLELRGYGTHGEALAAYADVDIALDPFPFSGCATSCDALWMGVPVVTLCGEAMVARQSASLLASLDLSDLAACDLDGYIAIAAGLARDPERLGRLRAGLRQRVGERLGDVRRHAGEIETALRSAWRERCAG